MSTTSIYRLGRDPAEIGECRNAWRGAMYVWDDIAKRYFGLDGFPMFDERMQDKVWNAPKHHHMPVHERIVLLTTMDNAVVRGSDLAAVIAAFEQYGQQHPRSSLSEQASILKAADVQPDDLIAWQQTSVSEFWGQGWDEEKDEATWYDPAIGDKHFDAYASASA